MKAIPLVALLTLLAGCAAQVPPAADLPPPTAEEIRARQCDWATMLAASGKLAAALAVPRDADQKTKDAVLAATVGVDEALATYCGSVGTTAEHAALMGLRKALDTLTLRTLATPP